MKGALAPCSPKSAPAIILLLGPLYVFMCSALVVLWYQILLSPICSCIHFQAWFYFIWPHLSYIASVFAWYIIIFARFMHCYRSILTHIQLLWQKLNRRHVSQCTCFHWQYNLHWIVNLKQGMQHIYYINSTSLGNNSKPKAWYFQQDLILSLP